MRRISKLSEILLVICIGLMLTGSSIMVDTADVEDGWVEFKGTPENVQMPAFAQCPGDVSSYYVIGGRTDRKKILNTLWRYDAGFDEWRTLAPLPIPLVGAAATCYKGSIYVAGGITTEIGLTESRPTDAFLIYDIDKNSWRYGPRLARRVWGAGLGAWKGKLYLFGGARVNYDYPEPWPRPYLPDRQVDVYNLLGSPVWIPNARTPMPFPASHFGWVQSGKYIYVVGGRLSLTENSRKTQRFDIDQNYWMRGPSLPIARYGAALVNTESHLHLIGGFPIGNRIPIFGVMSLEKRLWPDGVWITNMITALNVPLVGTVGFCTEVNQENALWVVGGMTDEEIVVDTNQCHAVANCFVDPAFSDSDTLTVTPMWLSTYLPLIERQPND